MVAGSHSAIFMMIMFTLLLLYLSFVTSSLSFV